MQHLKVLVDQDDRSEAILQKAGSLLQSKDASKELRSLRKQQYWAGSPILEASISWKLIEEGSEEPSDQKNRRFFLIP